MSCIRLIPGFLNLVAKGAMVGNLKCAFGSTGVLSLGAHIRPFPKSKPPWTCHHTRDNKCTHGQGPRGRHSGRTFNEPSLPNVECSPPKGRNLTLRTKEKRVVPPIMFLLRGGSRTERLEFEPAEVESHSPPPPSGPDAIVRRDWMGAVRPRDEDVQAWRR